MAASSDLSINFPKQTVTELTSLAAPTAIAADTKSKTVINVLGKAVRLLKLAAQSDEITIKKDGKTYEVNLETL